MELDQDIHALACVRLARKLGAQGSGGSPDFVESAAQVLRAWRERTSPDEQEAELATLRAEAQAELDAERAKRERQAVLVGRRGELIRELLAIVQEDGSFYGAAPLRSALEGVR